LLAVAVVVDLQSHSTVPVAVALVAWFTPLV
jgi:hypothetical protein